MSALRGGRVRSTLALAALAGFALFAYGQARANAALADAELKRLRAQRDSLAATRQRIDTVYAGEKLVFAGLKERWDTLRVAHLERLLDSLRRAGIASPETVRVEVPVQVLVTADSTIRACSALVLTCEQRVEIRDRENANLSRQVQLLERRTSRAWTAAGLSYDPRTGDVGGWVERDLWRFRGGVGITPGVNGLRAELRAGWRW